MSGLRVAAVGDRALAAYPDDPDDARASARVRALDRALRAAPFDGIVESVPSVRSLLVVFDPDRASAARVGDALRALAAAPEGRDAGTLHLVPTRYGGDEGPDLPEVARACGLSEDAFVARHCEREYRALMLGFRPGFAYLGWLPEELRTRRKATPRVRVPAGSVAVAALQTAIYPSGSAGGWNLIGRTSIELFDPSREPPVRIGPDDRVRFVPTRDAIVEPEPRASPAPGAEPVIEVLDGGLATTVQDGGRAGHRRFGVAQAGALDAPAAQAANAAVGNAPDRAVLECTVTGPALRFLRPVRFALAGADLGALLERADLGDWPVPPAVAVLARPGNVLRFAGRVRGCRAYIAFAGGLDVPVLLGSRSTDLTAGFGGYFGRTLRAGDVLALGPPDAEHRAIASRPWYAGQEAVEVRALRGPQDDHFPPDALERFFAVEWRVGTTSDRAACRLEGPRLGHTGPSEISSEGMVPGSIQVPPDGQPIVMLADGPTTGGYPKIATVVSADLPRLAQVLPGSGRVRFREP
ncbi:MAG TPA: 5-oxoprolinase subunit PxpB [Vicinamibacteria bacterium]|nr:5-oxoprolinase subunit PxpB [Vicinamibacteria bacterium]